MQEILKRLCFFLLCILSLSLFAQKIIDTDIWWHLSAGRYILQNGAIPASDPFSYTAGGNEWIDLHWLFQVIVYSVYHSLGSYSLSLLFMLVYATTFATSWLTCRRDNPPLLVFFFLWLALMAAGSRFLARPEAFTYLMLALYTYILYKHHGDKIGRSVFFLLPLQALWTNLQGLFILGPCLIFAYAAEAVAAYVLSRRFNRIKRPEIPKIQRLVILSGSAVLVSLMNPYGLKGLLFPVILFTRAGGIENIFASSIAELQPPFSGYNLTIPLIFFGIFTIMSTLALVLDWRNARLSHIIIFFGMGYLGLTARRNVPIFIFAFLPLAIEHAQNALTRWRKSIDIENHSFHWIPSAAHATLLLVMLFQSALIWTNQYYISDKRAERFGFGFKSETFPQAAFTFVKEENLHGPFFNSLDNGGMFMWEMFPSEKVFIDPRLEVNSEATFAKYCRVLSDPKAFETLAQEYDFNAAVISHTSQDGLRLLPAIYNTPGWFLIYLDPVAAVFARETDENLALISKNRGDVAQGPIPDAAAQESINEKNPRLLKLLVEALDAIVPSDTRAQSKFNLGLVFLVLGQNERAAEQFKAGLELQPDSPEAYYNLGLAFDRMGRQETAIHCYKETLRFDGRHSLAHANLGKIYDERGLKDEAEREYKLSLRGNRDKVIPLYNLGALYLEKGRRDDARKYWKRALKIDPAFQPARDALDAIER